jgi:hypothetical protein
LDRLAECAVLAALIRLADARTAIHTSEAGLSLLQYPQGLGCSSKEAVAIFVFSHRPERRVMKSLRVPVSVVIVEREDVLRQVKVDRRKGEVFWEDLCAGVGSLPSDGRGEVLLGRDGLQGESY